jgi:endonuclease/exonuclease/phosphatase family metal-dependent hydrolase
VPTFSIASFNARWGMTPADVPFDVGAAVAGLDTDLVAVQELWAPHDSSHDLERVAAEGGYRLVHVPLTGSALEPSPHITADPGGATGTWGVALLSRLPVRRVRIVDLGRLVERWDVANRYAILAEVEVGGVELWVAALHLSFALPNALAQLRRLDGYLPRHRPSVVVGDCNLWGPLAERLVGRHRRAVRGRTWPADRPHSQLDHILVSPEIEVVDGRVLRPVGSDHRPITAVLRVEPG